MNTEQSKKMYTQYIYVVKGKMKYFVILYVSCLQMSDEFMWKYI